MLDEDELDDGLDELDGFSDELLSDELLSDELDELDGFHEIDDADELAFDESESGLETDEQSHDGASLAPVLANHTSHAPSAVPRYDVATKDLVPAMPANLTAPGVNLGAYINTVHQIPILTPDEERELAERYYQDGDVEAARLLVMSHLRFVIHIARSYSGYGLSQADLIQEGNLGLMKAVKRFDPTKGVRLVSFAVHWIKAEIHEFVIKNWRIVKVATTKAHRKLFFNLRSLKKSSNQLTLEEAEAIAKDLNVTVKQVLEMESRLTSYDASFELQDSDDEDGRYAPQLFLEDGVNPAEMVEDADWEENTTTALKEAMDGLDERSRDIITQRWLADQKSTLHDLAAVYNISAERVRQIEKNAMDKIREAMTIDNMLFD
ncbi:RNA polymerase factor sigma-32 [Moraxella bovis]|nr:RNA polymerase sigma factor RpoH [Moraxella bovis]OOR90416.1 RNA polymerase factor sigma-32 [Moraxella bovis]